MKNANLVLHCGANLVAREALAEIITPEPTDTWYPIGHTTFLHQIERALMAAQMEIVEQSHSLTREGARYFGLMQISSHTHADNNEFAYVLGLRNSIDKSFPAAIVAGAQVFVCDNLAFSGEIKVSRKHTLNIMRDLPRLVGRAVGLLSEKWTCMERRIENYKSAVIDDRQAHDLLIRSLDCGAATPQQIPAVLNEWRHPRHEEFAPRNAWSLFNSFTEVAKEGSLAVLPKRTTALHGLLDSHIGFRAVNAGDVTAGMEDAEVQVN